MDKDIFIKLLAQREFKAVRSILDVMNEVDIASLLSTLSDKELALAFRLIPKDKAAEVFSNMDTSMQTYLVTMFTEKALRRPLYGRYGRYAGRTPGKPCKANFGYRQRVRP